MAKPSRIALFKNRDASFQLFEVVRKYLESLPGVQLSVAKTQVAFKAKRQFAWVWLPQMWITSAPENSIVVSFRLDHPLHDTRIKEVLETYPGRFMHHVVVEKPSHLQGKLKKWLRVAQEQASH
jgi:hypothetical protein